MTGPNGGYNKNDDEKKRRDREFPASLVDAWKAKSAQMSAAANTPDSAGRFLTSGQNAPRYNISDEGRQRVSNKISEMGINNKFPISVNPPAATPAKASMLQGVTAPAPSMDKSLTNPLYNDEITPGDSGKPYGLSITPGPDKSPVSDFLKATRVDNPQLGFVIPNAPTRGFNERAEREKLMKQASTVQEGARGLTATQMNLMANLQSGDDKLKNDVYTAQLNAASNIAQGQMREDGSNARAALQEASSDGRFKSQLGFDAQKFQETLGLDKQRVGIEQSNSDVQNYGPKKLNDLYEQYDAAETDEDRLKISEKLKALQGGDKEQWVAIGGGESLGPDGMTATKNPDVLLNRNSGEIRQQPKAAPSLSDPVMLKLQQSGKYSQKELEEIVGIHMAGGDVSGYLE